MTTYLPALAGGLLVGLAAVMLMGLSGRIAGISGILGALSRREGWHDAGWRVAFLAGLVLGPLVAAAFAGHSLIGLPATSFAVLIPAGLLVGFGTVLGGGCTSGHGVCGMARLSPRSIAATAIFMSVAAATVFATRHVL